MAFSPVEASENITKKYYRYLKTAFRIGPPYADKFENLLKDGKSLAKGPFLDITDTFEKGHSLNELIEEGLLPPSFARIGMNLDRPLYRHQEESLRKVAEEKRNLVVSTGTGSGKTESFLLPILRHLTMEAEAGTLSSGVRALLIYPMNALANDQTERLRKILKEYPEITFGAYTGQTAQEYKEALENYKSLNEGQMPIANELISRDQMIESPPHILITNYAMLEYLMLRPRDSVFFEKDKAPFWKFIVFDEAHVYNGSTGIEVSMLFRRLRAKLENSDITYILTSATLGDEKSNSEVAEFAKKLCNAPFESDDVVRAYRILPTRSQKAVALPISFYEEVASAMEDTSDDCMILKKLGLAEDVNLAEYLYDKVSEDDAYWKIRFLLETPKTVHSIAQSMNWTQKQVADFVSVASRAEKGGIKLFDARYHMFIKAPDSAFATLAPHNEIMLERCNFQYAKDGTCYKVFEVATCIYCGAVYLVGKISKYNILEQFSGGVDNEDKDLFLLGKTVNDTDEDHLLENENVEYERYVLCPYCGRIEKEGAHDWCEHSRADAVSVMRVVHRGESHVLTKCLHCENVNTTGVVRMLFSGQEASTSVIGTALFEELPSHVYEASAAAVTTDEDDFDFFFDDVVSAPKQQRNIAKQFIAFSDSRQAAAFYASYLNISYNGILYKRLIREALQSHLKGERMAVPLFADELQTCFEDNQVCGSVNTDDFSAKPNRRKEAWKAIFSELVDNNGNTSMSKFGLLGIGVDLGGNPKKPPLNDEEYRDLCDVFALSMMSDAAINYRSSGSPLNENDVEDYTHNGAEYGYTCSDSSHRKWKAFIPSRAGLSNKRVDYLQKVYRKKGETLSEDEAADLLKLIWEKLFVRSNVVTLSKDDGLSYKLDAGKIVVYKPKKWYICKKCKKVTCHNIENVCPAYHCDGELEEFDPETYFQNNHYFRLYNDLELRDLRVVEHTAQLNREQAYEFQKKFKEKEIDILSCSTTFEMGVDVGDLETVFMRNMPPMPANYAQRAGRAGRSKESAAYALTFCNKSSHDFSYFDDPTKMIKGRIDPPKFAVENDRIARRHLYASALSFFWKAEKKYFCSVGNFLARDDSGKNGFDALKEYLESKPADLETYIERFLPRDFSSRCHFSDFGWVEDLVGNDGVLTKAITILEYELAQLEEAMMKLLGEGKAVGGIQQRIKTYKSENILTFLSRKNVIPKYGFPVDTVEMSIEASKGKGLYGLQLQRDLSMAISEYAPGSQIVANNKLITSRYIKKIPTLSWKMYSYTVCPECSNLNIQLFTEDSDDNGIEECCQCGKVFDKTAKVFLVPEYGFVADPTGIRKPGLKKPERTYRGEISYVGGKAEESHKVYTIGKTPVHFTTSHNDELAVLNTSKFYVCESCGYADVFEDEFTRTKKHTHKNVRGLPCAQKTLRNFALGYTFLTDVVKIRFDGYDITRKDQALSILYGLLRGISSCLNIEESDVAGCLQGYRCSSGIAYSLIFFDTTPGGAGHVKRLDNETVLNNVFRETLNIMEKCTCGGEQGDTSCYSCLRSYKNQKIHDLLKRKDVIEFCRDIL